MKTTDIKKFLSKFWQIVWKDDSFKGWIISIIFLFVVIKLIFFPVLNLATGTELPLAIVESCSMYHQGDMFGNYDEWYGRHEQKYSILDITKEQFKEFTLKKGFNKGDILFIIGVDPEDVKVGDIIIFNANHANPIIHRVMEIKQVDGEYFYSTLGDNNNGQLAVEKNISETQLVGKAVFKLAPYLGWVKLAFFELQRPESQRGICYEN
ncbi:signal peptidase I [archaeon]|jgi:signal peptidase I|nr:signal peptidase I [archaeon]